jgi:hypothetical protein
MDPHISIRPEVRVIAADRNRRARGGNQGRLNRIRLAAVFLVAIGVLETGQAEAQSLFAAVLPASRSVQVGEPATVFVTIINAGTATATSVGISLRTAIPADFSFQTTDQSTNQPTGSPNATVDIPAGLSQSFLVVITPTAQIPPTDVTFNFSGTNTNPVAPIIGLNTLLLSASTNARPDVIALSGTLSNDGVVNIPSVAATGAFSVAAANVGAGGSITVSADTGSATLAVELNLCQTDPQTGQCTSPIGPEVTTQIDAGATPTFSVFVTASALIPFDPANIRVFVRFKDAGGVTRGSTSVALRTNLLGTYQGSGTVTLSDCRLPSNNGTSHGTFTAVVTSQVANTVSGTFTLMSGGEASQVMFTVTLTPSGDIVSTTVSFSVTVFGIPVGSGTATLTGQFTGDAVTAEFSGQLQGLETCTVTGSGTATRT